jgi:hypothetical protein
MFHVELLIYCLFMLNILWFLITSFYLFIYLFIYSLTTVSITRCYIMQYFLLDLVIMGWNLRLEWILDKAKLTGIQIAVLWDVIPCCLVDGYQRFGGTCSLYPPWILRQQVSWKYWIAEPNCKDIPSQKPPTWILCHKTPISHLISVY